MRKRWKNFRFDAGKQTRETFTMGRETRAAREIEYEKSCDLASAPDYSE
jgi:hypothetical protein